MAFQPIRTMDAAVHLKVASVIEQLIASGAISTDKLADLAVTDAKLASGIAQSKIANLVSDLAAKAALAGNNTFSGSNTFNNPVVVAAGTQANEAVNLSQLQSVAAGVSASLHPPVQSLAALKAVTDYADKQSILVEDLGVQYRFDAQSTAASDDAGVIRPTDVASDAAAGRWIKQFVIAADTVTLSGDQTVSGAKTFAGAVAFSGAVSGLSAGSIGVTAIAGVAGTDVQTVLANLRAQIAANATAVSDEATARADADAAIQSELDAVEAAIGLNADGSLPAVSGNYLTGSSLVAKLQALDAQVKTNSDAVAGSKTVRVFYVDGAAAGTASIAKPGALPAIPDDDTVEVFVNGLKWRRSRDGVDRQYAVVPGGGSIDIYPLDEVSDIEVRYMA